MTESMLDKFFHTIKERVSGHATRASATSAPVAEPPGHAQQGESMESNDVNAFIARLLNQGVPLTEIQERLKAEKGVAMTFLDLRLLAAGLKGVDWSKQVKEEPKPKAPMRNAAGAATEVIPDDDGGDGDAGAGTSVTVSPLARPGAIVHGTVRFASGAKADWMLDQFGRLGLENAVGKPTKADIEDFQIELQNVLARMGR